MKPVANGGTQITYVPNHIPQLDGLRGVAILLVISYHYFGYMILFSLGWCGVDLFFVLSGFLITGKLLDTINDRHYFLNFFRNRILRIFPLYYLTLIVLFVAFLISGNENLPALSIYYDHWPSFFIFTQNWTFILFGLPGDKTLVHFWSLAVEEQFYLVWPFIIYFIKRDPLRIAFLLLLFPLIIALRIYIYSQYPSPADYPHYYFNTLCRMDSLAMGSLVCVVSRSTFKLNIKMTLGVILLTSILIIIGIFQMGNAHPVNLFFGKYGYTLLAIFFAAFLIVSILSGNHFLNLMLTNSYLRFCGKISYGLYIFHWPVRLILGVKMNHWIFAWTGNLQWAHLISLLSSLVITFLISALSFRYFEERFLRLKHRSVRKNILFS